jgi:hypothetical protein
MTPGRTRQSQIRLMLLTESQMGQAKGQLDALFSIQPCAPLLLPLVFFDQGRTGGGRWKREKQSTHSKTEFVTDQLGVGCDCAGAYSLQVGCEPN